MGVIGSFGPRLRQAQREEGHYLIALVRLIIAAMALAPGWHSPSPTGPYALALNFVLLSYLAFAAALLIARVGFWIADVRLGRLALIVDEVLCALIILRYPMDTGVYLAAFLFLQTSPLRKLDSARSVIEYVSLLVLCGLHDRIANTTHIVVPIGTDAIIQQLVMLNVTALIMLASRLAHRERKPDRPAMPSLLDSSTATTSLPVNAIAELMTTEVGAATTVIIWRQQGRPDVRTATQIDGEPIVHKLTDEDVAWFDAATSGGSFYLYDRRSGNALVARGEADGVFTVPDALRVPEAIMGDAQRACFLHIQVGKFDGIVLGLGLAHLSGAMLYRLAAVAAAIRDLIGSHQMIASWRAQAFAQARLALSRDMHDSVLQTLAGLRLRLSSMLGPNGVLTGDDAKAKIADLQAIIAAEQACLRELIVDAAALGDDEINLVWHLRQRLDLIEKQWNIDCSLTSDKPRLAVAADMAVEVEFLVRESISNAVQHADATRVHVVVAAEDDHFFVTIKYDSKVTSLLKLGDSVSETIASRSLQRRLAMLGGTAYEDMLETGVLLSLRIPVELRSNGKTADS